MTIPHFEETIREHNLTITRTASEILQINVGKRCNQACTHCHVEAGPTRTEMMDAPTAERLIELLSFSPSIHTVDITGGAPELNPHFCSVVKASRGLGKNVIDRCNLTVFFEPGQEKTPPFLASHQVHIIASLPCYSSKNVDLQRGKGVFEKSIKGLLWLNELGYGQVGSGLELDLVYNPVGPYLPPSQKTLEKDYKVRLLEDFGITFNRLYTITNMPIKRFLLFLEKSGQFERYMELLVTNFNSKTTEDLMCRSLISVSFDGKIYDCDFNQMLDLPILSKKTIWDIESFEGFAQNKIVFANHCYGCTAGAGSSCSGTLT